MFSLFSRFFSLYLIYKFLHDLFQVQITTKKKKKKKKTTPCKKQMED